LPEIATGGEAAVKGIQSTANNRTEEVVWSRGTICLDAPQRRACRTVWLPGDMWQFQPETLPL